MTRLSDIEKAERALARLRAARDGTRVVCGATLEDTDCIYTCEQRPHNNRTRTGLPHRAGVWFHIGGRRVPVEIRWGEPVDPEETR